MESFWYYLYNLVGVPMLYSGIKIGALTNSKIRLGLKGRKQLFQKLEHSMALFSKRSPRFWIHTSSMGEFEQAKPLIDCLKKRFPKGSVIVSFFSPSVFENVQEYEGADVLCYLPFDSRRRADRFLSLIQPDVAIVVRHDLWPNHLYGLKRLGVPAVLINSSVRSHSIDHFPFSQQINRFFYDTFHTILTVSTEAKDYYRSLRLKEPYIEVVGDTRYDQVVIRAKEAEKVVLPLRSIKGKRRCFVMGSTWPSDEDVLIEALFSLYKDGMDLFSVFVPHEPTVDHINLIERKLSEIGLHSYRFSQIGTDQAGKKDVLIVDRIGILASLYALGELSFVGGGFGPGVHNVLEPAALGQVVLFGPRHKNSYEAGQLKKNGVGFSVISSSEIYDKIKFFLGDELHLKEKGSIAENLVKKNLGATDRIVNHLEKLVCNS